MKRFGLYVLVLVTVLAAAACGSPITPTPVVTPTGSAPIVAPTSNFRATENAIVSHVFATLTASAPTPTKVPAVPPTTAATSRPPTNTPRPAAARPTNTPLALVPAGPRATVDPYLAQIPKGQGGVLVANYVGDREATFTLNGQAYLLKPNEKRVITILPGTYKYSVSVPGLAEISGSDVITIPMDQYVTYSIAIKP